MKHNPRADHALVIGPYTHLGSIHQSDPVVGGYAVDPVARMDFHALRYAWFDHVLKGAARPAILADRVNYQVMGSNQWRHAPSLEAMGAETRRLFLAEGPASAAHVLHAAPRDQARFVETVVDLQDRMKGETILQFHGIGPYDILYVNPGDDPTRSANRN